MVLHVVPARGPALYRGGTEPIWGLDWL